jgi:hypothetical protein
MEIIIYCVVFLLISGCRVRMDFSKRIGEVSDEDHKDGAEPKPSTVIKVGEAGSKMQAQKALSAKPAVCSTK